MAFDFNANYYLLQYPDVAAAVVRGQFASAYDHFVLFGARELRNPNAEFNALEYAALNPDVAAAVASGTFSSLWEHYVHFGLAENRAPNAALAGFDAAGYLALNTDVAAAVASGAFKSAIDHYLTFGQAEGRGWGNETQLTNGTDTLVGNKFVAGQVYNPGGTDRINSLQDEDQLTGIGENPTLTATLGNANDNGGTTISPILNGIETVNVAFTGSGANAVTTLDLQDSTGLTGAVNISRITDENATVSIRNLTSVPAELSVSNTHSPAAGVNFTFLASATAGTADATQLTLSNAQIGALKVEAQNGTTGIETINLVSKGSANSVGTLTAQDLQTLNISGDQDFTLTTTKNVVTIAGSNLVEATVYTPGLLNVAGSLSKIDGSTATGNLTLNLGGIFAATQDGTSGTDIAVEVLGGKGNDTFILTDTLGANDKINGGEGKNTVVLTAGNITGTAENVQTLDIRANAASPTIDTSKLAQLETVIVRNESNVPGAVPATDPNVADAQAVVVTLNKLTSAVAENAGITVKHGTTGNNDLASLTVVANLADATGASDTVVFNIAEGVNADARFNVTLTAGGTTDATRVENITLNDNDSESNTVALTNHTHHTGTITLKGGVAGQFLNLDYSENALRKATDGSATDDVGIANTVGSNVGALVASVIDAEDFVGDVILRVSTTPVAISAVGAQTVKLGSGNDTLIFDNLGDSRAGLSISDTVSGGAGNDTLAIGGDVAVNLGASEWTNVSGFETIRLLGNGNSYTLSLTDQLITQNAADGKIINIINDNDTANDVVDGNPTVGVGTVSAVTIDARSLAVGLSFNYKGEEGGDATADRFIFGDAQMNSSAVIDGGAVDNLATTFVGNSDVIEVRNAAVLSAGDLANIKNVGIIELTNDQASVQNFTVQLNDAIVDAMVDSFHTSTAAESETLVIRAIDNALVGAAHSVLRLEAGDLTARSNVDVTGGGGVDTIIVGMGANIINGGGGADLITLAANNLRDTIVISDADDGAGNLTDIGDVITGFQAGAAATTDLLVLANGLGAGIDTTIDGGIKAATGAFAETAELVIITTNSADFTLASVSAAIGSATGNYALNDVAIFAVSNGTDTGIYRFESSGADAAVSAGELTLVGTLNGVTTAGLELNNFAFG